ncbi:MAG: hypothetical protein HUK22_08860, partial [Thermoguttaceae bacterium]|nr:hypothetical protein [Thermoguttaceae bacterium]
MRGIGTRRSFWSICLIAGFALCAANFPIESSAEEPANAGSVEMFGDLKFENGFRVSAAGKVFGDLRLPFQNDKTAKAEPTWALAAHASKYDLTKDDVKIGAKETVVENPGQRVSRKIDENGDVVLTLAVSTDKEYAAPRAAGEWWIHLLLCRDWKPKDVASFGELDSLVFVADARVA